MFAIDVMWPDKRPRDPVAALHNHLFRLRRGLSHDVIESAGDGYRLDPSRIDLDADRLAAAVTGGEPVDPAVVATIDEALERWHGPAYPELDDFDDGRVEAVRLAELRMRAVEVRAECRLAAGLGDDVVVALAALAAEEPLRERPRALLMTALTRVRPDRRGVASLRRLPARAQRRVGHRPVSGVGRSTRRPAPWRRRGELGPGRPAARSGDLTGRPDALLGDVLATVDANRLMTLIGPGGVGKSGCLSRSASVCGPQALIAQSSCVSWPRRARTRRWTPSRRRSPSMVALVSGSSTGSRPCSPTTRSCCCSTTASTSSSRSPAGGGIARQVPKRGGAGDEQGAPAGGRRAVVYGADARGDRDDDPPAVELFVERARAVAPGFDPERLSSIVAEIVRRLDGLPLAIELAAARLHTLDVAEVAAGLDRRFRLLSAGSRTSSRHGSLERGGRVVVRPARPRAPSAFADLSVFAGSFTVATPPPSATSTGTMPPPRSTSGRALAGDAGARRRYVLLETLRAFGAELLRGPTGAAEVARERHAHHVVERVEAAEPGASSRVAGNVPRDRVALPELRTPSAGC